jgi:gamma-glutamyl:cysteine ligase YbdK (ATP-grasp superfamily)
VGAAPYTLFEAVGLELEYAIVDADFRPRPLVEPVLRAIHGRPVSETMLGPVGVSCELAAHVLELKTPAPVATLDRAERDLVGAIRAVARILAARHGARLLPTGMHPLMRPAEATLWQRSGSRIYRAYDRLFGTNGHGWLNVQASHVNLPFGTEEETVRMHNAIALLLPYLPALAASSPFVEGRRGRYLDARLGFYRTNQRRIPLITGDVVPEYVASLAEYRRRVLRPIYRALGHGGAARLLRHEWVNSRGAIVRFTRRAIEIRILDMQECVKADVAIAVFVRAALKHLVERMEADDMTLPAHGALVRDLGRVIREGRAAQVEAAAALAGGGRGRVLAGDVLAALLEEAEAKVPRAERRYLPILADRVERGSLSERIVRAVAGAREGGGRRAAIRRVYDELAECLVENRVFGGPTSGSPSWSKRRSRRTAFRARC